MDAHDDDSADGRRHRHDLPGGVGASDECLLCPVCVFLQAITQSRPEVTQHLLAAAHELTLALKAVFDTQAAAHRETGDGATGFQRINLD